jgi:hypothetical protein
LEFIDCGIREAQRARLFQGGCLRFRLRNKFTDQLAHFKDLDSQCRPPIPGKRLFVYNIAREPDKRHSLKIVFAVSGDLTLDQKEATLVQALEQIVGRGMRGLLSCIQSDSHSETEAGRFILERHDPPEGAEPFRLVVGREDENSYVEWGIFETVASALEGETIIGVDADELNTLRTWFTENLERPTSYGLIKLRHGVCRFKAPASEHVRRIW